MTETDRSRELLYIGIKGQVLALDRSTGEELWRVKLENASIMTLALVGQQLFAGVNGELYCLSAADGQVLWHNRLKGLGTGFLTIAAAGMEGAAAAASADEQQQAAVTAAIIATTAASSAASH